MKNLKTYEDGTFDIPTKTLFNVITRQKIEDNILKGFEYNVMSVDKDIKTYIHTPSLFITADEIIASEEIFFVVSPTGLEDVRNYQQLYYSPEDGFTSNKNNYHY